MSNFNQEGNNRLVCGNCGHRTYEPEKMIGVENVNFCDRCAHQFTFIYDRYCGLVALKEAATISDPA